MTTKRFHCEGGAAYAALIRRRAPLLSAIVALQTISDYLDTVCDRGDSADGADYRRLHSAMLDAVACAPTGGEYYALHPRRDDGGYLEALVEGTRRATRRLPGYPAVSNAILERVRRYADLQEFKHLRPSSAGIAAMERWYECHRRPRLFWWEYAAACGSTLGMFALMRLAAEGTPDEATIGATLDAYIPWICGLHILLDYFIDQHEDAAVGEVNLVAPYRSEGERRARLLLFFREARAAAARLPDAPFHLWIVDGLPGLYLADPKALLPGQRKTARAILAAAQPYTRLVWAVMRLSHLARSADPASCSSPALKSSAPRADASGTKPTVAK
jgi:tetraprenyl-beta-curcumene synthase